LDSLCDISLYISSWGVLHHGCVQSISDNVRFVYGQSFKGVYNCSFGENVYVARSSSHICILALLTNFDLYRFRG
jgi:hypothetical protein